MIKLPRKIVLCGVSGSGKSTLGDHFNNRFWYRGTAFADPLKRAAQEIFGFSDEHLWGPSSSREVPYTAFEFSGFCFQCQDACTGPERHLHLKDEEEFFDWEALVAKHSEDPDFYRCDTCGAQYGRYITPREALRTLGTDWGRKFCPDLWANACFVKMDPKHSYVVTDCRFRNERHVASRYRACTVLLLRGLETSTSPHPSEAEVRSMAQSPDLFDLVLDNREGTATENFEKLLRGLEVLSQDCADDRIEWHHHEDRSRGLV